MKYREVEVVGGWVREITSAGAIVLHRVAKNLLGPGASNAYCLHLTKCGKRLGGMPSSTPGDRAICEGCSDAPP